jgi:UDPglucose 6-dehydrogenase
MNYNQRDANENSIESFAAPYEACKDAHAIAVLTIQNGMNLQIMIGSEFTTRCKTGFCFDGRNVLNGPALKAIGFVYQAIDRKIKYSDKLHSE